MKRGLITTAALVAFWTIPAVAYWLGTEHPTAARWTAAAFGTVIVACFVLGWGYLLGVRDSDEENAALRREIDGLRAREERVLERIDAAMGELTEHDDFAAWSRELREAS